MLVNTHLIFYCIIVLEKFWKTAFNFIQRRRSNFAIFTRISIYAEIKI